MSQHQEPQNQNQKLNNDPTLIGKLINACASGNLDVVKELIQQNPNIDIRANNEELFRNACEFGYLEIVKYLISLNKGIYIHIKNEYSFRWACHNGHLEVVKYLISLNANIDIHADNEGAFRWACWNGHLEIVKYLISLNVNIDIHANNEGAFRAACYNGHLEVVKYLISLNQNIDIRADNEEAFRLACYNGHLEVVKYLISLNKNIDIHVNNEDALRFACDNGHLEVVKYLASLLNTTQTTTVVCKDVSSKIVFNPNIKEGIFTTDKMPNDIKYDSTYKCLIIYCDITDDIFFNLSNESVETLFAAVDDCEKLSKYDFYDNIKCINIRRRDIGINYAAEFQKIKKPAALKYLYGPETLDCERLRELCSQNNYKLLIRLGYNFTPYTDTYTQLTKYFYNNKEIALDIKVPNSHFANLELLTSVIEDDNIPTAIKASLLSMSPKDCEEYMKLFKTKTNKLTDENQILLEKMPDIKETFSKLLSDENSILDLLVQYKKAQDKLNILDDIKNKFGNIAAIIADSK